MDLSPTVIAPRNPDSDVLAFLLRRHLHEFLERVREDTDGSFASAAPLRRFVLPSAPEATPARPVAPERPRRMLRDDLLRRVFLVDLLAYPCGGRLRLISVITQPDVVEVVAAAIILSRRIGCYLS